MIGIYRDLIEICSRKYICKKSKCEMNKLMQIFYLDDSTYSIFT